MFSSVSLGRPLQSLLCSFLLLLVIFQASSQVLPDITAAETDIPDSIWSVDSVMVVGNSHTKDFVVLREMTLKPGVPITRALLDYDRHRIYSLRLFNSVDVHVVPTNPGHANVIVVVHERWFLYPFPILGIKDRDWSKLYYGAGVQHTNFRGRNEKLFGSFALGYDPWVSLVYRNPFLNRDGTDFLETRALYGKVRNRSVRAQTFGSEEFDEEHYSASMAFGKRFGIQHAAWLSIGYQVVDVPEYRPGRTIDTDGSDRFVSLGVGYQYDTRDLIEYPSDGNFFRATVSKYGLTSSGVNVVRYALDARRFQPLPVEPFVLGVRLFTDIAAGGPTPSYNRVFFGYADRIRGHFREVFEGESRFGATAELHYSLFEPMYLRVGGLPSEFSVWRFGVVAALFADAGQVWFRGEPVALNRFVRGYGAGIHILLPYSAVLRIEYAWNELRRGEFILDAGLSL